MKEVLFNTGGRRLRIEDLETIQKSAIDAISFLNLSKRNFVVSGCKIEVEKTPATPNADHPYSKYTFSVGEGYAFMNSKLRHVPASEITIAYEDGKELYIVTDDYESDPIQYLDGDLHPQFHHYDAKVEARLNEPDIFISLQKDIDWYGDTQPVFCDFISDFLNVIGINANGIDFEPGAKIAFKGEEDYLRFISNINDKGIEIGCKDMDEGGALSSVNISHDKIAIKGQNNQGARTILSDDIIQSDKLGCVNGNFTYVVDIVDFINDLKQKFIEITENKVIGSTEDGDIERHESIHISPENITIQKHDDGDEPLKTIIGADRIIVGAESEDSADTIITGNSVESYTLSATRLLAGNKKYATTNTIVELVKIFNATALKDKELDITQGYYSVKINPNKIAIINDEDEKESVWNAGELRMLAPNIEEEEGLTTEELILNARQLEFTTDTGEYTRIQRDKIDTPKVITKNIVIDGKPGLTRDIQVSEHITLQFTNGILTGVIES